jgi:hypothetical protein
MPKDLLFTVTVLLFIAWVYFVIAVDDIVFISDIDDSTA